MTPYRPAAEGKWWLKEWMGQAQTPEHPPVVPTQRTSVESRTNPLQPGYVIPTTIAALAVSSAGAWIGIRTGIKEGGFTSVAGWVTGVSSILVGLAVLSSLVDPAVTPKVLLLPLRLDVRS